MTTTQIASRFQCTPEQLRRQYLKNAASLDFMAAKATRTGKRVNGFTADDLRFHATNARTKALQCAS